MAETRFVVGQRVRARSSAQFLTEGATYRVLEANASRYAFGSFVTYVVQREGYVGSIEVRNAHLLLEAV